MFSAKINTTFKNLDCKPSKWKLHNIINLKF